MDKQQRAHLNGQLDFDDDGPRIGPIYLIRRTAIGFQSRSQADLEAELSEYVGRFIDASQIGESLAKIAYAMNVEDFGLAAIITSRLSLRDLVQKDGVTGDRAKLLKASADDTEHPGYPAGTPDGKGGQFRPKATTRLVKRRSIRSALKRVLTTKRLLRLLGENAVAALTEAIPGVDAVVTAATVADDLALLRDIASELADTGPAVEFAEKAPFDLQDLQVSDENLSFESYAAFKKGDLDKQFGPAGDGMQYHHLAEQGPNAGIISDEELQSTDNIVRIPQLLHEEINSFYATPQSYEDVLMTPRNYLRGQSFEEQRSYGIDTLRRLGAVK